MPLRPATVMPSVLMVLAPAAAPLTVTCAVKLHGIHVGGWHSGFRVLGLPPDAQMQAR